MSLTSKYVPRRINDFCGNTKVVRDLYRSVLNAEGNRCFLVTGETGTGKTTIIRLIAQKLMKLDSAEGLKSKLNYHEYCGVNSGGIDNVRHIIGVLNYALLPSEYRLWFYDECHGITREAQNVLLKPLTQLPKGILFFLATSEPERLIPALVGRCDRFHLETPTKDELVVYLDAIATKEGKQISNEILSKIADIKSCRPRESLVLLDRLINVPPSRQMETLLEVENLVIADQNMSATSRNQKINLRRAGLPFKDLKNAQEVCKAIESCSYTSTAFMNREFGPETHYIKPFLSSGSLGMVHGRSGHGKTNALMYMALLLTREVYKDKYIGNLKIEQQCGVLIVDGEMPGGKLWSRLNQLSGPLGDENADQPLRVLTSDDVFAECRTRINLTNPAWREGIFNFLESNPQFQAIFFDNLSSLAPGVNENDKASWDPIGQWLLGIRSLGRSVILAHHSGKGGQYRGHSSKIDYLDFVIAIKKLGNVDELCFQVDFEKLRSGIPGDGDSFVLRGIPHPENPDWLSWDDGGPSVEVVENDDFLNDQIMAQAIIRNKSQTLIAEEFQISQSKVSNLYRKAKGLGLITSNGDITESGKSFIEKFGQDISVTENETEHDGSIDAVFSSFPKLLPPPEKTVN